MPGSHDSRPDRSSSTSNRRPRRRSIGIGDLPRVGADDTASPTEAGPGPEADHRREIADRHAERPDEATPTPTPGRASIGRTEPIFPRVEPALPKGLPIAPPTVLDESEREAVLAGADASEPGPPAVLDEDPVDAAGAVETAGAASEPRTKSVGSVSPATRGSGDGHAPSERAGLSVAAPGTPAESFSPGMLRSLIDEASHAAATLDASVAAARASATAPEDLESRLQEQLRVGAQFLTAFQKQIDRAEATIGRADDREATIAAAVDAAAEAMVRQREIEFKAMRGELATALEQARVAIDERARRRARPEVEARTIIAAVDEHVEALVADLAGRVARELPDIPSQDAIDRRVDHTVETAIERFDAHAAQSRRELDGASERLRELHARSAAVTERLDAVESRADVVAEQVRDVAATVRHEADEVRAVARQCTEARATLAAELRRATAGADDLAARGERMKLDVTEQLTAYDRIRRNVTDSIASVEDTLVKLERIDGTVDRLQRLLDRLQPWEELLCRAPRTASGLPKPAMDLVAELESGIGRDMEQLSRAMLDVSQRVATLAGGRGKAVQTTEPRPAQADPGSRPDASEAVAAVTESRPTTAEGADEDTPRLQLRRTGST